MKTVFTLAIGFWIGRQIYINYDQRQALAKEKEVKNRLLQFLKENGLDPRNAKLRVKEILDTESVSK